MEKRKKRRKYFEEMIWNKRERERLNEDVNCNRSLKHYIFMSHIVEPRSSYSFLFSLLRDEQSRESGEEIEKKIKSKMKWNEKRSEQKQTREIVMHKRSHLCLDSVSMTGTKFAPFLFYFISHHFHTLTLPLKIHVIRLHMALKLH